MSNNGDKIYYLLEKVYIELQDTKKEVSKIGLVIENEIKPNTKSLFNLNHKFLIN